MIRILQGDCRKVLADLPDGSVHCVVTSPPYWGLRDYGHADQIGSERHLQDYIDTLTAVFRDVRRVLRPDGTCWLNLGDSYISTTKGSGCHSARQDSNAGSRMESVFRPAIPDGLKPKDLAMVPARVALALQADGWWLRSEIVWHKPNPMPESVTDRPSSAHEKVFLLTKSERYLYDAAAVSVPAICVGDDRHNRTDNTKTFARPDNGSRSRTGKPQAETRNLRNVWTIATKPFKGAHFATFPPDLAEICIKAGCPEGGTVIDPFGGAGTVGLVADRMARNAILIELNQEYATMARGRIESDAGMLSEVASS